LNTITKLTSPFAPFIAEELFQNLNMVTRKEEALSVHLVDFPSPTFRDEELEEKMEIAQKVVYLTRAIRAKSNLKVRQPLRKIMIAVEPGKREAVKKMTNVILEEVNIKELEVLKDDSGIVNKSAKANFKTLGPKYGKLMKQLATRIKDLTKDEIKKLETEGTLIIELEGNIVNLATEDVEIISTEIEGWVVETEGSVTVAIDSELDDDLIAEGFAREFVNRVQNMRKSSGLDIIDRINVGFRSDEKLEKYLLNFKEYISNEILADTFNKSSIEDAYKEELSIGEYKCEITIKKVV
jgi:isoleucyl-tRNA synthetase